MLGWIVSRPVAAGNVQRVTERVKSGGNGGSLLLEVGQENFLKSLLAPIFDGLLKMIGNRYKEKRRNGNKPIYSAAS